MGDALVGPNYKKEATTAALPSALLTSQMGFETDALKRILFKSPTNGNMYFLPQGIITQTTPSLVVGGDESITGDLEITGNTTFDSDTYVSYGALLRFSGSGPQPYVGANVSGALILSGSDSSAVPSSVKIFPDAGNSSYLEITDGGSCFNASNLSIYGDLSISGAFQNTTPGSPIDMTNVKISGGFDASSSSTIYVRSGVTTNITGYPIQLVGSEVICNPVVAFQSRININPDPTALTPSTNFSYTYTSGYSIVRVVTASASTLTMTIVDSPGYDGDVMIVINSHTSLGSITVSLENSQHQVLSPGNSGTFIYHLATAGWNCVGASSVS